eukprot:1161412-Pelagomonas_calceolata.AAC.2
MPTAEHAEPGLQPSGKCDLMGARCLPGHAEPNFCTSLEGTSTGSPSLMKRLQQKSRTQQQTRKMQGAIWKDTHTQYQGAPAERLSWVGAAAAVASLHGPWQHTLLCCHKAACWLVGDADLQPGTDHRQDRAFKTPDGKRPSVIPPDWYGTREEAHLQPHTQAAAQRLSLPSDAAMRWRGSYELSQPLCSLRWSHAKTEPCRGSLKQSAAVMQWRPHCSLRWSHAKAALERAMQRLCDAKAVQRPRMLRVCKGCAKAVPMMFDAKDVHMPCDANVKGVRCKGCVMQRLCNAEGVQYKGCAVQRLCNVKGVRCKGCAMQRLCDAKAVRCKGCATQRLCNVKDVQCKGCVMQRLCDAKVDSDESSLCELRRAEGA